MQHLNTQNVITGEGYNFLGTHFWSGQDFWTVNLRGAIWALAFDIIPALPPISPPPPNS